MKILIVEDNKETSEIIKIYLEEHFEILQASKGFDALTKTENEKPEIIILDINLPDINGFTICEKIKSKPIKYGSPFIIMLTASSEQENVIKGLKTGADDYIKKPFNGEELFLRVIKYKNFSPIISDSFEKYKNISIDMAQKIVLYDNCEIELTKKEYELLLYFIKNKGLLLSREKLLENIWENNLEVDEHAVNQCIKRLRKKIPLLQEYLEAKRGFGYRLKSE